MAWREILPFFLIASCTTAPALHATSSTGGQGGGGGQVGGGGTTGAGGDASVEPDAAPAEGGSGADGGGDAGALSPPWVLLDLSGWSLDLPVNAEGQESGTNDATLVDPIDASFPAKYDPYFYTGSSGGVVMYAPVDGATTTNSYYPRCELAEKAYSAAHGGQNWPLSLGGTMKVAISVDSVPSIKGGTSNGDVVIGQIKGTTSELCKIRYTGGSEVIGGKSYAIYVEYNNATVSGSFGLVPVASRIPLSKKLSYEIKLANNAYTVSISYGGSTFSGSSGPLDASWSSDTYYFKAGVYTQANSAGQGGDTEGTGAGEVSLYALGVTHP